ERSSPIPSEVRVNEHKSSKIGVGVGASTNTGARTQFTYDNINLLDWGWRVASSLRLEQRARRVNVDVALPTSTEGYRESLTDHTAGEDIENQGVVTSNFGVQRRWGGYQFEQSIAANYLIERQKGKDADSNRKDAATIAYGITIRRTDHKLMPTRGYLLNA